MKALLIIFSGLFILSSCQESIIYKGRLYTNEKVSLEDSSSNMIDIPSGIYNVDISIIGNQINLGINEDISNNFKLIANEDIVSLIKSNVSNFDVSITNQPYDIKAVYNFSLKTSEPIEGVESCYRRIYSCDRFTNNNNCSYRNIFGKRRTIYTVKTKKILFKLIFFTKDFNDQVATFNLTPIITTKRNYLNKEECKVVLSRPNDAILF